MALCLSCVRWRLKDTVIDFDDDPVNATGFGFDEPCHDALLIVLQRALLFYLQHPEQMHEMQLRSMRKDFSWTESAKEYIKMYDLALSQQ